MKQLIFSALACLLLLFSCANPRQNNIKTRMNNNDNVQANELSTTINIKKTKDIPTYAIKGDFNGDNSTEWAWLIPPEVKENEMDCIGKCDCTITFSNSDIPNLIIHEYCIGGKPQNERDLNNDGTDEISIIPHWFTSSWRSANVYHLTENGWKSLVRPIQIWLNSDSTLDYIQKDLENTGHVIITEHRWTDEMEDIIVVSESMKVDYSNDDEIRE